MKQTIIFLLIMLAAPAFAQGDGRMQYGVRIDVVSAGINAYDTYNITAGWRFNRKNYLGIGTGCHVIDTYTDADPSLDNGPTASIPIYLDYVHYFPFKKHNRNSFFLGIEAGPTFYLSKLPTKDDDGRHDVFQCYKMGWDYTLSNRIGLFFGPSLKVYRGLGLSLDFGVRF